MSHIPLQELINVLLLRLQHICASGTEQGKDNILILAVTSAIEDTDNSLAEPFAVEVDPQRLRTIGVYTKMDKADLAW